MTVETASTLLTTVEAAEMLRVSRSKVYALVAAGRIPSTRITGSVRIPRAALEAYIDLATTRPAGAVSSREP